MSKRRVQRNGSGRVDLGEVVKRMTVVADV